MNVLNDKQSWVMEVPVCDMTVEQKVEALSLLSMMSPLRSYTEKAAEIRESLRKPRVKRKRLRQDVLFEGWGRKAGSSE